MKLEPCDVLLFINEGTDIFSKISRWGAGRYSHVSLYLGEAFGDYLVFESNLRGASLVNLKSEKGRLVKVMRPNITLAQKQFVISNAINLASDERAAYDIPVIILSCVPRILNEKTCLDIPYKYCRDIKVMCCEGVAECYWRAYIWILPKDKVPLMGDFETSPILEPVYVGRILEDIVP